MKIKAILIFVFFSYLSFGQSPQKFTYQSIIKNSSGYLLKNQDVGLRISVLSNSSNGIEVYSEEHFPTSNSNGLVTLIIGEGLTNDNFSEIQWGDGEFFLKVEVDPEGGNNYTMNQTSQLLSVPYALYAENSGSKLNLLGQDFITLQDQTLTVNKVDLADDVDGVLSIGNGGTGSSTAPMVGVITAVDSPAARVVLGLGTAATENATAFATAAQGALADTALQDATAFATAAQGALADTALQASNNLSDITNVVAARTALGIDVSGTDNSTNVSLAGSLDYLTLSGQAITLGSITNDDLAGSIADSKLNQITSSNKVQTSALDIDGANDIGAAIVDSDLIIIDDGAAGTNRKAAVSRLKTYIQGASSLNSLTDVLVEDESYYLGNEPSNTSTTEMNIAIGLTALDAITTGDYNVAVGSDALTNNSSGNNNIAIGRFTMEDNISGYQNTAFGNVALQSSTSSIY